MQNQNQNQKQTQNNSQQHKKSIWTPVVHFAAHTFVGSLLFVIVGAPAVGLSMLVHALEAAHLDGFTVEVLVLSDAVLIWRVRSTVAEMVSGPSLTARMAVLTG